MILKIWISLIFLLYEAAQLLDQEIGKEARIRLSIGGPFTVAAHILSPDQMMKSMLKNKKETLDYN